MNGQATTSSDDPRLGYEIRLLELTARGQRACKQAGVVTIREFLARSREDFLRLRNCGDRTFDDIAARVREFLSNPREPVCTTDRSQEDRPIQGLLRNSRAERAFQTLGIVTVADFLRTPKEDLLAVKGFGERTYWMVSERIRQTAESRPQVADLLPESLLDYRVDRLGLAEFLVQALHGRGTEAVGEMLRQPLSDLLDHPGIGELGTQLIRESLDRLVRAGIDQADCTHTQEPEREFTTIMAEVLTALHETHREFFIQRVGLHGVVRSLRQLAGDLKISMTEARAREQAAREALTSKAPAFLARLRDEAQEEILAHHSIRRDRFRTGTLLSGASSATLDSLLPLRLIRFLWPGAFFLHGDVLSTLPPPVFRKLRREVRRGCARRHLPVPVRDLTKGLEAIVQPVPIGVVVDLILSHGDLEIRVDPELGEVVRSKGQSTADRLHGILVEANSPLTLEDILFVYRDLYRTGNMQRLLDQLRRDVRFLEVGRATWSLRSAHVDELYLIAPEANAITERMIENGERRDVLDMHTNPAVPERRIYLVIDCMRRDPRVRYLGRGRFCVRGLKSAVMEDIAESMKRAMGEIPVSRFVDNQPRDRRRLAECLLHHNRALVETAPNRIDSLSNYPFNAERLERLFHHIAGELDRRLGYSDASAVLESLETTDLGGDWLSEHMLLDLLRRHARFELLPGGIIARLDMGLGGWIQRKIRECLRDATSPLDADQILGATPDIRDFTGCIAELAQRDPMVLCSDEGRYAIL